MKEVPSFEVTAFNKPVEAATAILSFSLENLADGLTKSLTGGLVGQPKRVINEMNAKYAACICDTHTHAHVRTHARRACHT